MRALLWQLRARVRSRSFSFYTESWPRACANAGREADKSDMAWIGMEQQRQQALTAFIYRSRTAAQYIEIILSEL